MKIILFSLSIIIGSLLCGFWAKERRLIARPQEQARTIAVFITKWVTTLIVFLSFWEMRVEDPRLWTLPVLAVLLSLATIPPAIVLSTFHRLSAREAGSFVTSALFSNVGYTMGGFLAFAFLGEEAFGLTVMYCLLFRPLYIIVGFGIASFYGRRDTSGQVPPARGAGEGLRLIPFLGLALGVVLHLSGIRRPDFCGYLNALLIPGSTFIYMFAVGLTLQPRSAFRYRRLYGSMSFIKFIYTPVIGVLLATAFGYRTTPGGLLFKVVLIESAMPVALASLMLPTLFDLDQDLTNALWLATTIAVIPLIFILRYTLTVF